MELKRSFGFGHSDFNRQLGKHKKMRTDDPMCRLEDIGRSGLFLVRGW